MLKKIICHGEKYVRLDNFLFKNVNLFFHGKHIQKGALFKKN